MKSFIWTVIALFALNAAAACFNIAKGVELTTTDRAVSAAIEIVLALWGVYVIAGGVD